MSQRSSFISLLFAGFSWYYVVAYSSFWGVNYLLEPITDSLTCSNSDLHTVFNFLWNDYQVVLKKVTNEQNKDQQDTNYVLLHNFHNIHSQRVLGVVNIKQYPYASFSYKGFQRFQIQAFNGDKIEIQLLNSVSSSYVTYTNLKTQDFISLHIENYNGSNSSPKKEDKKVWKMKLIVDSDFVLDLVWSTNCSFSEKPTVIMKTCWFELTVTIPSLKVLWIGKGFVNTSQSGNSLLARLERNDSDTFEPIRLEANWTCFTDTSWIPQLSADLILGVKSLLSLNVIPSKLNEDWKMIYDMNSRVFDWHFFGNLLFKANIDERLVVLTSEINYLSVPSKTPIKYSFGYIQTINGSRIVDLRHNITSPLYIFEGNMTVEKDDKNSAVVTEIWQKIYSPVTKGLFLNLRQIFHQSNFWNWETVVMRSGLVDMHVSAHWNNSVLDYYRKRFQFHSHAEETIPSFSLTLEYNNRLHFHNYFHFPFLALAYGVTLNLTPYTFFPIDLQVSMQDEFISNSSHRIAKVRFYQNNGIFNFQIDSKAEMDATIKLLQLNLIKTMSWNWKSSQHPLNQLLQPIIRRPTLEQATNHLFSWFRQIPEIGALVSKIMVLI